MEKKEEKDTLGAAIIPEAKDRIRKEDADKVRALVKVDIAKFKVQRAQAMQMVTDCDFAIAQQEHVLADLDRREANVGFPPAPEAEAPNKGGRPKMGKPVGGKEGK